MSVDLSIEVTCCTCGHKWRRGLDGSHCCASVMRDTMAKQELKLGALKEHLRAKDFSLAVLVQSGMKRIKELEQLKEQGMDDCKMIANLSSVATAAVDRIAELESRLKYAAETFDMLDDYTAPGIECDAAAAACREVLSHGR